MSLKGFDWYSGLVGFLGVFLFCFIVSIFSFSSVSSVDGLLFGGLFCLDYVSCYLALLSVVLWVFLLFWYPLMSFRCFFLITLSVMLSVVCYCCVHALWFWLSYESCILCLFLLLVLESPYSERYLATWYLLGYILVSGLPMLVCIYYMSSVSGSFELRVWDSDAFSPCILVFLCFLFITKVPLFPFHVWLPIVHAEASSPVSVCLSGYVMKLGILGVYRFCGGYLQSHVFSGGYLGVCLGVSVLFFFAAIFELDSKRWLAFMSLSHIVIAGTLLGVSSWDLSSVPFIYCFGHGLSAGVTFGLIWYASSLSGSRNWLVLKDGVLSGVFVRFLFCSCLCTVASIPPTMQFFCEVLVVVNSGYVSCFFWFLLSLFLFCSALVPLFVVGVILSRRRSIRVSPFLSDLSLVSFVFLVVWSFLGFFFV